MSQPSSVKIDEIEAISNASHSDPFSILGLHRVNVNGKQTFSVRVFRPDAKAVTVIPERGKTSSMTRISDSGFFEATFPRRRKPFRYQLEIEPHQGESYQIIDPYQFGPQISDFDLQLWGEGNHHHAYRWMGAHLREVEGTEGVHFVVAAPEAERVSVVGSFNGWDGRVHPMRCHPAQGIWEIFLPHLAPGDYYKFEIKPKNKKGLILKSDPYGFWCELRPGTASRVWKSSHKWSDDKWMEQRSDLQAHNRPLSVYEIHPGSWRRKTDQEPGFLNYRELADQLIPYLGEMGYTHVELMPVAEHPYDPSWGYQITGYFAVTSRYGTPDDFKYFVNRCHKAGIGVIVDWVPAHFTKDDHGLRMFDGTALYEHADPRQGEHTDWGTNIFNYGRLEVINFLVSNAIWWFEEYHIDGLRVDAVASMLYLDYSRQEHEWVPNRHGGRENLEAIHFLQTFNKVVHDYFPGVLTIAEESTSWQGVTKPIEEGGLGFDYKWNMGWMNDTLAYMSKDPIYRKYHQGQLTFSMIYAFSEKFILPFSHDEVVHMKQSMLSKMPGDDWQKFANLRLLYTYMYGHPGKKLLFMGGEFGQWGEWNHEHSIDWHLLQWETHQGVRLLVRDLNELYRKEPAMHQLDETWEGFEWLDMSDADNCIISFARAAENPEDFLIFVFNFTPTVLHHYKIGVPKAVKYETILNSDSRYYWGSNAGIPVVKAADEGWSGKPAHISITLPPLAGLILKPR